MSNYIYTADSKVLDIIEALSPEDGFKELITRQPELVENPPKLICCLHVERVIHFSMDKIVKAREEEIASNVMDGLAKCIVHLSNHTPKHNLETDITIGTENSSKEYFQKAIENISEVLEIIGNEGIEILLMINYHYMHSIMSILETPHNDNCFQKLYNTFSEVVSKAMGYNDFILGAVTRDLMLNDQEFVENIVPEDMRIEINNKR